MSEIKDTETMPEDDSVLSNVSGLMVNLEDRVETRILEETMKTSYLSYAMSVIVSRALPDVRDGLKPVHRRIIYAMHKLNLTPGSKYMKCARVVGDVLGKFHPHGDASVYNALARLAQEFSVRYTLVDGQGNFGSIDGDSPASMRYTECRMDKPATYIIQDIEKDTVDLVDNYDGSQREPQVLPALFPNLIVNGQTGIAVGMATEIPPHNLSEVVEAALALLENSELTIDQIAEFIKGPDLPTGGIIYGKNDILNAYKTGRGRCALRSKAELTENRIIITEIPYQVNKADLLIRIAGLVSDKKITGVRDIRDESNKDGIRVVIECKRDASPEVILNQLYKLSDLQTNIHFNMLALVNRGRQPKLLNLKQILEEYLAHRDEVVVRRTQFDLKKAEDELHILDGLKIALDFIDEVIKLIRGSYDKEEASKKLQERFELSERQAEAILLMRLQTLTNLDKSKIEDERLAKLKLIAELKEILENPTVKKALISKEIREMAEKLTSKRRTEIVDHNIGEYNKEDYVEEEDVLIQLTKSQYIKVLPITNFRQQGRGGVGVTSFNPKDEDWVKASMIANSHDYIYAFTNLGRVFRTRVFELPSGSRIGRGQALINYLDLREDEKVSTILTVSKEDEEDQAGSIIFATQNGLVKRTKLIDFKNVRKTGIIAIGLKEGDKVIEVRLSTSDEDKIILSGSNGKTVIFDRTQLSPLGRTAQGVKGMKLKGNDKVISLQIADFDFSEEDSEAADTSSNALIEDKVNSKEYPSLLVVTENGFGKQTHLGGYRKTKRAAGGVKTLNMTVKTGKPVLVEILAGDEESLIVTTKKGTTIRISPAEISQLGRNTQGIKVIRLHSNDQVVSGSVV
ncbi:DNA gyrase subunit A [Candidatus Gracilibacteria bacterium]|nr:DNA gyrase subunit A [Candidatus Gracilibacteria bacterium]NJS41287.1 DNA gyrase subunit A [Candidatus Gracilibacteria bacterium]